MATHSHPKQIAIKNYTYELPDEKIAKFPLTERDGSKLLIFKNQHISEDSFRNIADHLEEESILVFNTTKVINARLKFLNSKSKNIEIFCLEPADAKLELSEAMLTKGRVQWNCLVGNLKQWKETELVLQNETVELKAYLGKNHTTHVLIDFSWTPEHFTFAEVLQQLGNVPIPPYLNRESAVSDTSSYQTIYADSEGSVAAPTAGLHFTDKVMHALRQKSILTPTLRLHVGAGTFKPVKSELLEQHEMHAEWMDVEKKLIETILNAPTKKIIPVGTTSFRTLESLYWMGLKLILNPNTDLQGLEIKQWEVYDLPQEHSVQECLRALLLWMEKQELNRLICKTQILIAQPYQLKIAAGLITNFHQPQSTLLLLIGAVVGESWKNIYQHALEHNYRFLSYGDSSLLLK